MCTADIIAFFVVSLSVTAFRHEGIVFRKSDLRNDDMGVFKDAIVSSTLSVLLA